VKGLGAADALCNRQTNEEGGDGDDDASNRGERCRSRIGDVTHVGRLSASGEGSHREKRHDSEDGQPIAEVTELVHLIYFLAAAPPLPQGYAA